MLTRCSVLAHLTACSASGHVRLLSGRLPVPSPRTCADQHHAVCTTHHEVSRQHTIRQTPLKPHLEPTRHVQDNSEGILRSQTSGMPPCRFQGLHTCPHRWNMTVSLSTLPDSVHTFQQTTQPPSICTCAPSGEKVTVATASTKESTGLLTSVTSYCTVAVSPLLKA